jgi:prolyl-tRNA synthetase
MRASKFFFSTQKEAPADAELISHKLMMRAGLIRRLAGGIYTWMPLGLRVVRKIESIVREEMNRAGALEVSMPVVQPAELWQESGRYDQYGPELLRFDDRHKREFVLQPTSEEVITDIARSEIRSYRQLPVHFYQIQTKFRDERRPRFGVMRGREFVMKDGYSFHADVADLEREYRNMYDTYTRIFSRIGLRFRAVAADTGSIGGSGSHEFHVLADSGEDAIAYCADSDFAANVELAEALAPARPRPAPAQGMVRVPTPGKTRCEDVAALLGIPLEATVKAVAVVHEEPPGVPAAARRAPGDRGRAEAAAEGPDAKRFYLLLVRGDHAVNEIKVQKLPGLNPFRFATDREVLDAMSGPPGYIGPVGAPPAVTIIADRTVAAMSDFVCGANEEGYHLAGVNWGRDLAEPAVTADIRDVVAGDPSPDGKGTLSIQRGIEVGHIFQLRRKYSHAMKAAFLDASGKPAEFEMGCYGIGITRIAAAAIEQNHDERGIVWPDAIAPFRLAIAALGYRRSENVRSFADALYARLAGAGLEVLLDDRDERPGALLTDLELIGIPHRVVIGDRGLAAGTIEYQARGDTAAVPVPAAQAEEFLKTKLAR